MAWPSFAACSLSLVLLASCGGHGGARERPLTKQFRRALGLGLLGAAHRHLERAVALEGDKGLRDALARLLWWRGALRRGMQGAEAAQDFFRAHGLSRDWPARFDPERWAREVKAQPALSCGSEGGRTSRPASRPASNPSSGPTSRVAALAAARCDVEKERAVLRRALDGELLLACVGEDLLIRFRNARCHSLAIELAERLRRESPRDPRWPLALARAYWLGGWPERSGVLLEEHLYLSKTRVQGALRVARMLLEVGARRRAAAWAIRALAFNGRRPWRAAVVEILRRSGHRKQAETVAGSARRESN